mgnify:CR=1 FL=1
MSVTTEVKKGEVQENGKAPRNKKPVVPVFETEVELRAYPLPEGMKVYRVYIPPCPKGLVGFTADYNPQNAVLRLALKNGGSASKLDKVADPEKAYGVVMSLPPEELQKLLARVQANAHIAGDSPTGNLSRKK